jgi:small subunit ribosomal protein S23
MIFTYLQAFTNHLQRVIQRQRWLMRHGDLSETAAYDKARKEYYRHRHAMEVEARVAREEALAMGAFFGAGPMEVGMKLEDVQYENWKSWAVNETQALKQLSQSAYTGIEEEEDDLSNPSSADLQEISPGVPGSKDGLLAKGGAAVRPAN